MTVVIFICCFTMYLIGAWAGWNLRKKYEIPVDTRNKVDQRGCIAGGDIAGRDIIIK